MWWFLIPLLTGGLATPFVVAYAGRRLRNPWVRATAVGYFLLFLMAVMMNDPDAASPTVDVIVTVLFLITWLIGAIHTIWLEIRIKFDRSPAEPSPPQDPVVLAAQQRLARRNEARSLLTTNPALAAELRIGRPDLDRRYDDGGLVDINHVPAEHIARQLGIPLPIAEEIVMQRERESVASTPLTISSCAARNSPHTTWRRSKTGSCASPCDRPQECRKIGSGTV